MNIEHLFYQLQMQQEAIVSMQKQIDELKQANLELRQKVEGK